MMNVFERLPVEIILQILQRIGDYLGADSLFHVSPRVNAIFKANSRFVFENTPASWTIGADPEIQNLIRKVAIIRVPSFRCASLVEYLHLTSDASKLLSEHDCNEVQSVILDTMHMAAQIQRLACAVLSVMLQNFRSALRATPTGSMSGPDRERKAGWSPSWVEEYRTYWALWQLQHCWDLRAAAERRHPPGDDAERAISWGGWGWSAKEIDKLDKSRDVRTANLGFSIWSVLQALMDDLGGPLLKTSHNSKKPFT